MGYAEVVQVQQLFLYDVIRLPLTMSDVLVLAQLGRLEA